MLDIPAPEAGDSETVVSSLETAAIFGAKGDAAEALRWLQRAAESSGESGDDARTLTLARTVANLSNHLNGAPEGRKLPSPPARDASSPTVTVEAEEDATPFLLESRSRPSPPSSRAPATSTPPPPPSARSLPSTAASEKPSAAAMSTPAGSKSVTPSPPSVAPKSTSSAGSSLRSMTPMPGASRPSVPSPAVARASVTPSLPRVSSPPPKSATNGAANGSRPAPKSVTPSVLGAPPAAATAPKSPPPLPDASHAAAPAPGGRRARQAARVSVTRSLTERGLFFVRVLEEDQELADDAFEGLLVSNDADESLI